MTGLGSIRYGSTLLLFCIAAAIASPAQTFTSLHSFCSTLNTYGFCSGGEYPQTGLIQGTDGNLYGTTFWGGGENGETSTLFRITPSGTLSTLYQFSYFLGSGQGPEGALVQDSKGNLYGTYSYAICGEPCSFTTDVFMLTVAGKYTQIAAFNNTGSSGLVQHTNGYLYGTTAGDGSVDIAPTIYRTTPGGSAATIYTFTGFSGESLEGLAEGTDGNLYGVATAGAYERGGVFRISPAGAFSYIYSFCAVSGCPDGLSPNGPLVLGSDGNFYGTTYEGGTNYGCLGYGSYACGTVFKVTPSGALTTLYSFCSLQNCADGSSPQAGLVQGSDGNFYGTTGIGGANNAGTLFQITPAGTLTTLYSFCSQANCIDGDGSTAGLAQSTNGIFYGTTTYGGTGSTCSPGCGPGTVFSLSMGLEPFVQPILTMGKVGANIILLGNNLAGSTAVTFNGVPATFTVASSTEIKATVPTGALTGTLTVTTPSGTLSSNGPFWVTPQLKSFAPTNGPVGTQVTITGVSLTQTSAVSFNGVAASFTVNSDTQVTATVPSGATTGKITITTAGGTVISGGSFRVTK